ncbi:MAG: hypothetical protein R6V35_04345 [Candidatus Nanohaloarchaea archaeon]
MQSRFYDVAEAGSELAYQGNNQDLPFEFYEELVRENDIESNSRLRDTKIDNVVLDLSTALSGYLNHSWSSEFDVGSDRVYETLDRVFGSDLGLHWEPSGEDFTEGTFHDKINPREIFQSIAQLSDTADIYYPDHLQDGLKAAKNNHLSNLKTQGFSSYQEFVAKKDDYNKFCSQIITALNEEAIELHAMRDAGMYEEASNGYDHNSFNSLSFTEDDVIIDAAAELDGNTAIATFDKDFIKSDLAAFPPHLISQIWK